MLLEGVVLSMFTKGIAEVECCIYVTNNRWICLSGKRGEKAVQCAFESCRDMLGLFAQEKEEGFK